MIQTADKSLTEKIPPLSLQAWDKLVQTLSQQQATDRVSVMPEALENLRLTQLPGYQQILSLQDDHWVFQYEQFQEKLTKQSRKNGTTQNGVFYTPPIVARYLAERTLGMYLTSAAEQIRTACQKNDIAFAHEQWTALQQIRVIDPACGTGVFLVEAMKLFQHFYQHMQVLAPDFAISNPAHYTLTHHLAGVDIDPLSVMITEFRLAQWASRLDGEVSIQKPDNLPFYIGDTLQGIPDQCSEDSNQHTHSEPLHLQGHFILGNPPYVTEVRKQADRFRTLQTATSPYYQAKMDLCDAFLAWGLDHLQPGGQLAYVLPAYWTQRSSTASLRARLWEEGSLKEIWSFEDGCLFPNAPGHHSGLLIWQKRNSASPQTTAEPYEQLQEQINRGQDEGDKNLYFGKGTSAQDLQAQNLKPYRIMREPKSEKLLLGDAGTVALLSKLSKLPPLFLPENIQQGLVIPQGRLKPRDKARLPQSVQAALHIDPLVDPGVFLLNSDEVEALNLNRTEQQFLKPFYRPASFTAFQGFSEPESMERIIYTDLQNRRALESSPAQYPNLRQHLERFESVNTSDFAPYGLHRPRQAEWFEDQQKILAPRQVFLPAFAVVPFPAYVNEGFLALRASHQPDWLCALLNSDLAWFWFYHQKRKGRRLQIDKEVLCRFPQPEQPDPEIKQACMTLAQQLANPEIPSADRVSLMSELNQLVNQAYQLTQMEIDTLKTFQQEVKTVPAIHKN